jgi:hypothetical protein
VTKKTEKNNQNPNSNSKDFLSIIEGLKKNQKRITDVLASRILPGDYKLHSALFKLKGEEEPVGLVFTVASGKKDTYVLVDISVPHLQIGQKYTLPAKAKLFHKQEKVPLNRIKKAIVLVRKGTETISARPSRIRCPIIEIQLEKLIDTRVKKTTSTRRDNKQKKEEPQPKHGPKPVSPELLYALKEAIVHECLSTMHKRRNKYIRKGLWRWIEREILDPNVHFYLIILSSIYQGKTGDILSRRFRSAENFSGKIDDVISAIFSKETNLADEIKKNSERHKKALKKFLACFSQTPPFEYLKNLFLKEYRTNQDGLKARLSVFTTLNQLLERCGFEGEKETQYPLEILDELGIFQGIMTGNYQKLRIINASKKLKHLVPQAEWGEEEIYLLRNQLARALNLPAQEFNLNAFLPQAFVQDAKYLAEARKEAFRGSPKNTNKKTTDNEKKADKRVEEQRNTSKTSDDESQPVSQRPERTKKSAPSTQTEDRSHRERRPMRECDESKHRHFEFFGGVIEEDVDSVRLALAISRHEAEKQAQQEAKELETPEDKELEYLAEDEGHVKPLKASGGMGYPIASAPPRRKPSNGNNSNNNNKSNRRRRPGNRTSQNNRNRRPGNRRTNGSNK